MLQSPLDLEDKGLICSLEAAPLLVIIRALRLLSGRFFLYYDLPWYQQKWTSGDVSHLGVYPAFSSHCLFTESWGHKDCFNGQILKGFFWSKFMICLYLNIYIYICLKLEDLWPICFHLVPCASNHMQSSFWNTYLLSHQPYSPSLSLSTQWQIPIWKNT